jgi:hypothetical protein
MKLVVLTMSAMRMKDGTYGNCVAGITDQDEWVRLVSATDGDSLSDQTCKAFRRLDIIDVDVTPCPIKNHPENVKLEKFNKKIGRYITIEDVVETHGVDSEEFCFVNTEHILYERERQLTDKSLMLVKVQKLQVLDNSKARFTYNGKWYDDISVTDNSHRKPREYGNAYIVVSLPPETGGYVGYYKFIAAIYPL